MTTILINLTGDYLIPSEKADVAGCIATDPNLHELDAFLGALRGSACVNKDIFLGAVASAVNQIRTGGISNMSLEITSTLDGKTLNHTFRLVSHQ